MYRNSKGLTLLELMIVLCIIGVLGTMAMPVLGLTSRAKLKSSARDIASNLQAARINALRDGIRWRVTFDPTAKQYKVYSFNPAATEESQKYTLQKTLQLYDGLSNITFGSAQGNAPGSECANPGSGICLGAAGVLTFTSSGTANVGSIYIMDSKTKDTIQIAVANTGRIHIRENFGGKWGN